MDNLQKNIHLLSRATFGIAANDVADLKNKIPKILLQTLMNDSQNIVPLDSVDKTAEEEMQNKRDAKQDMAAIIQSKRAEILALNLAWMEKLQNDKAQLREKMTFFWHGHFACRIRFSSMAQSLNNIIRENALGNFGDLLMAVSKSPAMILFLNNQQNRKQQPNENFAREVMELFTMGRGNYIEKDVKEAARAFTGWAFKRRAGEFEFRENQHDDGRKIFLGEEGNFKGEDIIAIILKQKKTAQFIVNKIYKFFVNENIDSSITTKLADDFYKSNYNIEQLMFTIFSSDWFYDPMNVANRIKSPVELATSMNKLFTPVYDNEKYMLRIQQALGQVLFFPPNVAGWPGGRAWIDSSSLFFRLKLASVILNKGSFDFDEKDNMDDELFMVNRKQKADKIAMLKIEVDWQKILDQFSKIKNENELQILLLGKSLSPAQQKLLPEFSTANLKEYILSLLSLPEYQLS